MSETYTESNPTSPLLYLDLLDQDDCEEQDEVSHDEETETEECAVPASSERSPAAPSVESYGDLPPFQLDQEILFVSWSPSTSAGCIAS